MEVNKSNTLYMENTSWFSDHSKTMSNVEVLKDCISGLASDINAIWESPHIIGKLKWPSDNFGT
jgi:hypothetical protein